jgi:hypothetical protein
LAVCRRRHHHCSENRLAASLTERGSPNAQLANGIGAAIRHPGGGQRGNERGNERGNTLTQTLTLAAATSHEPRTRCQSGEATAIESAHLPLSATACHFHSGHASPSPIGQIRAAMNFGQFLRASLAFPKRVSIPEPLVTHAYLLLFLFLFLFLFLLLFLLLAHHAGNVSNATTVSVSLFERTQLTTVALQAEHSLPELRILRPQHP